EQITKITEEVVQEKLTLKKYEIFNSIPKYQILAQRLKRVVTKSMQYIVDSLKYSDFEVLGHEVELKEKTVQDANIQQIKNNTLLQGQKDFNNVESINKTNSSTKLKVLKPMILE